MSAYFKAQDACLDKGPLFWTGIGAVAKLKPRPPQLLGSQITCSEMHKVGPVYTGDQLVAEAAIYGIHTK